MKGSRVWTRAGAWLAGAAMLPALAIAQTTPSGPQTDPSLDRFSLPPSTRPSPRPTPPTTGPIVAPLSSPTPAAPVVATPTPAPSAAATPAARTPTPRPTNSYGADAVAGVVNVVTKREITGVVPTPTPTASASASPTPQDALPSTPIAAPTPAATASPAVAETSSGGLSTGLLIALGAAVLALVALGGFLLGRRRGVRHANVVEPAAVQPVAAPPEPTPVPSGTVEMPVRRRGTDEPQPQLEIILVPKRAGTNLMGAAVDYRVTIRNTGPVAARDIRFAMYMLSASARQAQDLQMIFATTIEQPVVAPFELAPQQQMDLSGMAMLEREQINVMTIEGRPWFVPVLAMKADYRWGENVGAPGVATAAHMIGIDRGEGAKMSPFRLDEGPHMHPEVAERKVA